jgi:O-methyltransferase domain
MVDLFPPVATLAESFEKYPQSEVPTETAMNVAFNTKEPFFSWLQQDKARRERFNVGMAGFSDGGDRPQSVDVKAYPWQQLPKGATVVDVGGGSKFIFRYTRCSYMVYYPGLCRTFTDISLPGGHVSKALAESFPSFTVIVQDASEVVEQSNVALAAAQAEGRLLNVSFQEHNFFSPQPVKDADVYFLRQIMHDWPKKEATMILRALLPALKPGTRVLVSEYVIPPPGRLTGLDDKIIR